MVAKWLPSREVHANFSIERHAEKLAKPAFLLVGSMLAVRHNYTKGYIKRNLLCSQ
ncbi:MAG: hypothetical protein K940chlam9_00282 [Chlamydiae bacterium]|nr:hypothetical protein [Chlamydiota bacterium]